MHSIPSGARRSSRKSRPARGFRRGASDFRRSSWWVHDAALRAVEQNNTAWTRQPGALGSCGRRAEPGAPHPVCRAVPSPKSSSVMFSHRRNSMRRGTPAHRNADRFTRDGDVVDARVSSRRVAFLRFHVGPLPSQRQCRHFPCTTRASCSRCAFYPENQKVRSGVGRRAVKTGWPQRGRHRGHSAPLGSQGGWEAFRERHKVMWRDQQSPSMRRVASTVPNR
jgi:hypothetical protein